MAEDSGQTRTEAPTQRRREEARRQGQVAVSQDLTAALLLLAAVLALRLGGPTLAGGLRQTLRTALVVCPRTDLTVSETQALMGWLLVQGGRLLAPFLLLLFAASAGVLALQVGVHIVPELLEFKPERLAAGWQRIFSVASAVRGLTALLKAATVAGAAYLVVSGAAQQLAALDQLALPGALAVAWDLVLRLGFSTAVVLLLAGGLDYAYQRYHLEQTLQMTKQELIDEHKREEGDPQIKARIRKLAREYSQRRMMRAVPRASVVVTNPTHLAVALRYDKGARSAPRVVAKGAGHVAHKIVDLARRHAVPVVERKPVARALFKAVALDREIPLALYQAVAEVLAYVYRLRGEV
jgi:flagellar biosynthetic protein FlhB